jgi:hypothetical protein
VDRTIVDIPASEPLFGQVCRIAGPSRRTWVQRLRSLLALPGQVW